MSTEAIGVNWSTLPHADRVPDHRRKVVDALLAAVGAKGAPPFSATAVDECGVIAFGWPHLAISVEVDEDNDVIFTRVEREPRHNITCKLFTSAEVAAAAADAVCAALKSVSK
jgi:hypothetical protein